MADTIWFRHDIDSLTDRLMQRIMRKCGMAGIGVFWSLVEALYRADGYIEIDHIDDLAFSFHVDSEIVRWIVEESELFEVEEGQFFSERILREIQYRNEKSDKAREKANKRWNNDSNATAMQQHNDSSTDAEQKECKPNASTVQYSTEDNIPPLDTKVSIPPKGKRPRFEKPSVDEVAAYCREQGYSVDSESFVAFYDSNGWKVGRNPMKDWKRALVTWEKRKANDRASPGKPSQRTLGNDDRWDEYLAKQEGKHAGNQ